MHRASPTLLLLAACLTGSLLIAVPASADESTPPTSDTPAATSPASPPTSTASPDPSPSPVEPTSETAPQPPDPAPAAPVDVLVSVNAVMAAQAGPGPSIRPPRARLPLRLGHYGMKVARAQERLAWLGYDIEASNLDRQAFGPSTVAAVKDFQTKNWRRPTGIVDDATWKLLARMAEPVGILPLRCTEVKQSLCIDKTSRTLRYVVKGKVKLTTDARFGAPGMETGEGIFTIKEKSYNHVSSLYHSWMPRAMFFNGDEAVHYSPDFNAVGYSRGSHGCVGIRDMDAATRLFNAVAVGTRVYVYWS